MGVEPTRVPGSPEGVKNGVKRARFQVNSGLNQRSFCFLLFMNSCIVLGERYNFYFFYTYL